MTITLDAPDNLSTSLSSTLIFLLVLTWLVVIEKISKEQLSIGIVQSCSVLLFLNDEVSVCRDQLMISGLTLLLCGLRPWTARGVDTR